MPIGATGADLTVGRSRIAGNSATDCRRMCVDMFSFCLRIFFLCPTFVIPARSVSIRRAREHQRAPHGKHNGEERKKERNTGGKRGRNAPRSGSVICATLTIVVSPAALKASTYSSSRIDVSHSSTVRGTGVPSAYGSAIWDHKESVKEERESKRNAEGCVYTHRNEGRRADFLLR